MPSNNTAQDESGDRIPRWAATAGHQTLGQRLTAMGARLFRSATDPDKGEATPSWHVRQHVLRDYHAANLAAARTVSEELVRAGFNTGDVPYGYRARRVRVTPAGRRPRWRTRLLIEPVEASTVRIIFVWRGEDRLSTTEIRRRLAASRYPAPLDPETGEPGMWTVAMVRAILCNPKYLGRQVWGRTHLGKPTPQADWVWSEIGVHPPLVTAEEFASADRRSWQATASAGTLGALSIVLPPDRGRAA
ncbi:recombinase family protein [Amycolatopsis sp. NPDC059657]|uniref:recombinase family protein n=1 Tax=Amycolatopsis sp. NPDC059657 TaxID=3346899 RepID=UPI0036726700